MDNLLTCYICNKETDPYFVTTCSHALCEHCIYLNILMQKRKIVKYLEDGDDDYINCYCNKGKINIMLQQIIAKLFEFKDNADKTGKRLSLSNVNLEGLLQNIQLLESIHKSSKEYLDKFLLNYKIIVGNIEACEKDFFENYFRTINEFNKEFEEITKSLEKYRQVFMEKIENEKEKFLNSNKIVKMIYNKFINFEQDMLSNDSILNIMKKCLNEEFLIKNVYFHYDEDLLSAIKSISNFSKSRMESINHMSQFVTWSYGSKKNKYSFDLKCCCELEEKMLSNVNNKENMNPIFNTMGGKTCIALGLSDKTVLITDIEKSTKVSELTGFTEDIVMIKYDKSMLITSSLDKTIKLWNTTKYELIATVNIDYVALFAMIIKHKNCTFLISSSSAQPIEVFDSNNNYSKIREISVISSPTSAISSLNKWFDDSTCSQYIIVSTTNRISIIDFEAVTEFKGYDTQDASFGFVSKITIKNGATVQMLFYAEKNGKFSVINLAADTVIFTTITSNLHNISGIAQFNTNYVIFVNDAINVYSVLENKIIRKIPFFKAIKNISKATDTKGDVIAIELENKIRLFNI